MPQAKDGIKYQLLKAKKLPECTELIQGMTGDSNAVKILENMKRRIDEVMDAAVGPPRTTSSAWRRGSRG